MGFHIGCNKFDHVIFLFAFGFVIEYIPGETFFPIGETKKKSVIHTTDKSLNCKLLAGLKLDDLGVIFNIGNGSFDIVDISH
jgi:hypothetical protein